MSLKDTIEKDLKESLQVQDKKKLKVLRNLKSLILLTEERTPGTTPGIKKEKALLLQAAEQRRRAMEIYRQRGRTDLEEKEREELEMIETYLPLTYNKNDLREVIFKELRAYNIHTPEEVQGIIDHLSRRLAYRISQDNILSIAEELLNKK